MHVLSLPPAFVLSQDQTLKLQEFDRDPSHELTETPHKIRRFHQHVSSEKRDDRPILSQSNTQQSLNQARRQTRKDIAAHASLHLVSTLSKSGGNPENAEDRAGPEAPPAGERPQGIKRPIPTEVRQTARQFRGSVWRRPRERRRRWPSYRPAPFRVSTRPRRNAPARFPRRDFASRSRFICRRGWPLARRLTADTLRLKARRQSRFAIAAAGRPGTSRKRAPGAKRLAC